MSQKVMKMAHKDEVQQKAEAITHALLRVKGYLDDDLNPTEKAKGYIAGNSKRLLLAPKGKKMLQDIIDTEDGLMALLGRIDLNVSTEDLRNEVVKFGLWKDGLN